MIYKRICLVQFQNWVDLKWELKVSLFYFIVSHMKELDEDVQSILFSCLGWLKIMFSDCVVLSQLGVPETSPAQYLPVLLAFFTGFN